MGLLAAGLGVNVVAGRLEQSDKAVAGLRRMLGVRRPAHKNPGNRKRRGAKQPRPPGLPGPSDTITVGADPWAVLKNHPLAPKAEAGAGG